MRVIFIFIILFLAFDGVAQTTAFGSTSKTSVNPEHKENLKKKDKRLLALIKNNPKKTLMGNRCMDEYTRKLGFEYVLQPKGQQGNRTEFQRLMHNFGVKVNLLFKNGPFWKVKLNKKRKECMAKTGDYAG